MRVRRMIVDEDSENANECNAFESMINSDYNSRYDNLGVSAYELDM